MHPGYLITTVEYFNEREPRLRGHTVVALPSFRAEWMTRALMIQLLHEQAGSATRFWLIQSPDRVDDQDPNHTLEGWLAQTGRVIYDERPNGVRVTLYELPPDW